MTADFVIVSSWPNGVYLSKQLSAISKKVCYIDMAYSPYRPMGIFPDEGEEETKQFLESLGVLERQEGGFCLLSEQGTWHFQEEAGPAFIEAQENSRSGFLSGWLSRFASDFMTPVSELDRPIFSESLNLFSDYFLFYPHFRKKVQFQSSDPPIRWLSASEGGGLQLKEKMLCLSGESFPPEKVIGIGEQASKIIHSASHIPFQPDWEWVSFDFSSDLKEYEETVPAHFVSINKLPFPWTHDNLLSVFHNRGLFHVWCRQPFSSREKEDEEELVLSIQTHMQSIFPGVPFKFLKKGDSSGLFVYGQDHFSKLEESYILQGNLMDQLKNEEKIFNEVVSR